MVTQTQTDVLNFAKLAMFYTIKFLDLFVPFTHKLIKFSYAMFGFIYGFESSKLILSKKMY